jgi:hypothetical protein
MSSLCYGQHHTQKTLLVRWPFTTREGPATAYFFVLPAEKHCPLQSVSAAAALLSGGGFKDGETSHSLKTLAQVRYQPCAF